MQLPVNPIMNQVDAGGSPFYFLRSTEGEGDHGLQGLSQPVQPCAGSHQRVGQLKQDGSAPSQQQGHLSVDLLSHTVDTHKSGLWARPALIGGRTGSGRPCSTRAILHPRSS